jgi:hypothetical protein
MQSQILLKTRHNPIQDVVEDADVDAEIAEIVVDRQTTIRMQTNLTLKDVGEDSQLRTVSSTLNQIQTEFQIPGWQQLILELLQQ